MSNKKPSIGPGPIGGGVLAFVLTALAYSCVPSPQSSSPQSSLRVASAAITQADTVPITMKMLPSDPAPEGTVFHARVGVTERTCTVKEQACVFMFPASVVDTCAGGAAVIWQDGQEPGHEVVYWKHISIYGRGKWYPAPLPTSEQIKIWTCIVRGIRWISVTGKWWGVTSSGDPEMPPDPNGNPPVSAGAF